MSLVLEQAELVTVAAELFEAERRGDYHPLVQWADLPPQTAAAYVNAVRVVARGLVKLGAPIDVR